MSKIKYDMSLMKFMQLFENLTHAKVKDCIDNDILTFIVEENEIGKAIGKNGSNVRRLEALLKKKIKIVEFSSDVSQFVRNFIMPLKAKEVSSEGGVITITGTDTKNKGEDCKNRGLIGNLHK